MRTISINRALRELKSLNDRIIKSLNDSNFVSFVKGTKGVVKGYSNNKQYEEKVRSKLQSVRDLMDNRKFIMSAIVESNAKTVCEVAGMKMTVADAIERKNNIKYDKQLLQKLKSDFARANDNIELKNVEVEKRLDHHIEITFGKENQKIKKEITCIPN
ncbi:hypothetical protein [Chengkuizengella axinellae]|uniref:Uncharacterized protein n=1 Tax=Chengkuizengella axinellae TaxID=3064388 RepID=A0ABT9J1Q3_9BACL|nr:hypothetical protein [Chengkuizengella sp. 2205SS18-9]MDP5275545.1 hypothetical protein [Chengkuizengella sp. 2205SS18-9]